MKPPVDCWCGCLTWNGTAEMVAAGSPGMRRAWRRCPRTSAQQRLFPFSDQQVVGKENHSWPVRTSALLSVLLARRKGSPLSLTMTVKRVPRGGLKHDRSLALALVLVVLT